MPYYKDINLLFIHIPKTGGTSLEQYFKKTNKETLYSTGVNNHILCEKFEQFKKSTSSLQHLTYKNICKYKNTLEIDLNEDLRIITIVRNPYDRIISDLFYFDLIKETSTSDDVYKIIKKYIYEKCHDNHNIPQYEFLIDKNNTIIPNITIFKTETLTEDFKNYGFKDFDLRFHKNKQNINKEKYSNYLNNDSIKLINEFYKKDFELFNYEMKNIL